MRLCRDRVERLYGEYRALYFTNYGSYAGMEVLQLEDPDLESSTVSGDRDLFGSPRESEASDTSLHKDQYLFPFSPTITMAQQVAGGEHGHVGELLVPRK